MFSMVGIASSVSVKRRLSHDITTGPAGVLYPLSREPVQAGPDYPGETTMSEVLVTGGCGYIGSHTVLCLAEAGHQVVVLDRT